MKLYEIRKICILEKYKKCIIKDQIIVISKTLVKKIIEKKVV